jgi:hypothetical protein
MKNKYGAKLKKTKKLSWKKRVVVQNAFDI